MIGQNLDQRPKSGPTVTLTDDEFAEFVWHVGWIIFRSVPAAAFARHNNPLNTVKDYMDDDRGDSKAVAMSKKYARDIARRLSTEEMSVKWFQMDAGSLAGEAARDLDSKF